MTLSLEQTYVTFIPVLYDVLTISSFNKKCGQLLKKCNQHLDSYDSLLLMWCLLLMNGLLRFFVIVSVQSEYL